MRLRTEVLIVGGGVSGVGIARDLALRGIPCILVEKGDFASGASGRNHGLLHSGARYAVTDPEAARECVRENAILKQIAPDCIDQNGGLFISLPEDSLEFRDRFLDGCEKAGIPASGISVEEALTLEPALSADITGAIMVPDASIDPFKLVLSNAWDAERHGARILLYTEVVSLSLDRGRIREVHAVDTISGQHYRIEPSYVVNATGAWADRFLKLAGINLDMALSKGSMLITNRRLASRVINRCRTPSDGDIVVPNETVSILGTTSVRTLNPDLSEVEPGEVSLLIEQCSRMIPEIKHTRLIRAYAGIRPLLQPQNKISDRSISRGFNLIDHAGRDGIKNIITITGGKLTTYRLMAEKASDMLCEKMSVKIGCSTHEIPLPRGSHDATSEKQSPDVSVQRKETICDCELVTRDEVERIILKTPWKKPVDLLRRSRLGKGTCQGAFCFYRLMGILCELGRIEEDPNLALRAFLEERWKGIKPVLWGQSVKEEELIEFIYRGLLDY